MALVPISSGSPSASSVTIPDVLRFWPWPRHINPHYLVCKKESSEWLEAFNAFSPSAQTAFNKCDFSLLACLAYPLLDKDGCRIGCDLMNLFYLIDEHTDISDNETTRTRAEIVLDAIRDPHKPRPEDEWVGGRVAQQFWLNASKLATASTQSRFIEAFQLYMDAVVQQAIDRDTDHIRSVDSYLEVRRDNVGTKPSFAICALYMDIPDQVMNHPVVKRLTELSTDLIIIGNDLCSYKFERDRGDPGHNLVTAVMHEFEKDPQAAMDYMSDMHDEIAEQFLNEWKNIPTFGGPLDLEVRTYCHGLANWVRANVQWSFESERYFGKDGPAIQVTRQIQMTQA